MEEHKELESLVDKLFEADITESPSMGFTNQVLSKIEALKASKFEYKPLLPKWVFIVLGIATSLAVWYVLKTNDSSSSELNYLPKLDAGVLIADLSNMFNFSSSLGYSFVALGTMLCVQAVVFTKLLNKRLT